jgi:hypothetical protein
MPNRAVDHVSLLSSVFLLTSLGEAEPLVWFNSLDTARASAVEQGKLILLLAGRPTCGNCTYMKNEVCEAPNVRPVIDEACVPWFSDIDLSTDWQPYRAGLASFYLPLACVIDPKTTNAWLARRTGLCTATTFEDLLLGALH